MFSIIHSVFMFWRYILNGLLHENMFPPEKLKFPFLNNVHSFLILVIFNFAVKAFIRRSSL